jgi:hypothetical protein
VSRLVVSELTKPAMLKVNARAVLDPVVNSWVSA